MKALSLPILLLILMALCSSCSSTMTRTPETDKMGWTDPQPPVPPLSDHHAPGLVAFQRGVSPVSQPDSPNNGSINGEAYGINGPLAY
jgi:hypothetical protein